MFPLIINVALVLITDNSSPCGMPVVFWALSHRICCPGSLVKEGTRNKKAEDKTPLSLLYFREGLQWRTACAVWWWCFTEWQSFWGFYHVVFGRKVEKVDCLDEKWLSVMSLISSFIFWHKCLSNSKTIRPGDVEKYKIYSPRVSKFSPLIKSFKYFLFLK